MSTVQAKVSRLGYSQRRLGTPRPAETPFDFCSIKASCTECIPPSSHHDRRGPPCEPVSDFQFAVRCRVFNSRAMEGKQASQPNINAVSTGSRSLCLPYMPTDRDYLVSQVWKLQVVGLGCMVTIPFLFSFRLAWLIQLSHICPMSSGEVAFVVIVVTRRDSMYEVFILPRIASYILYVPNLRKWAARSGLQTFRP